VYKKSHIPMPKAAGHAENFMHVTHQTTSMLDACTFRHWISGEPCDEWWPDTFVGSPFLSLLIQQSPFLHPQLEGHPPLPNPHFYPLLNMKNVHQLSCSEKHTEEICVSKFFEVLCYWNDTWSSVWVFNVLSTNKMKLWDLQYRNVMSSTCCR